MARTSKAPNAIVKYYLLAYNVVACLGWSYILITLITHILSSTASPPANSKTPSILTRLLSSIPYLQSTPQVGLNLHPYLTPYLKRATTAFDKVGETTAWVQTLAVLEIIHAALGLVRSPLGTTAMQVFSRLALVWGIAEHYKVVRPPFPPFFSQQPNLTITKARTNPLYASMVLAWSLTEVVRYAFYAISLLSRPPYPLLYLRYTTFYLLYPLGAGSEAFLIYSTLPPWVGGVWTGVDYGRGLMFVIWWPALFVLYTHMMGQRRKVLGGTGKGKSKKKE